MWRFGAYYATITKLKLEEYAQTERHFGTIELFIRDLIWNGRKGNEIGSIDIMLDFTTKCPIQVGLLFHRGKSST